ncbi:hypothetical protein [Coxiella burnetii]|nr:hypothetical protein [Coxiella burnetii]ACJ19366.1 hypothetical protein CbuK_0039 [Coxiella burnetii CbuK_Q154]ATN85039.1 hypothetical protein AYO29_00165 [Coxiella burnetii str. Schperling]EDQ95101.1 hypothetical protein A35_00200 [Coxiella burnetii 'MSU Goat Q177']EDR36184.1 hypothetical protein COXBURSA334_0145 [Coxiella burnetii Q321]PHH57503.1 hypothetical protein CRH12_04940 [Coxiella burnetii]
MRSPTKSKNSIYFFTVNSKLWAGFRHLAVCPRDDDPLIILETG